MGGKDPRDLDSLGLARAQPGRSVAENEVPLWSLSLDGDSAGWTLSWSSGSPPFNGWSPPKWKGEHGTKQRESCESNVKERARGRGSGPRVHCQGRQGQGALQTGLLFLTAKDCMLAAVVCTCTGLQNHQDWHLMFFCSLGKKQKQSVYCICMSSCLFLLASLSPAVNVNLHVGYMSVRR